MEAAQKENRNRIGSEKALVNKFKNLFIPESIQLVQERCYWSDISGAQKQREIYKTE